MHARYQPELQAWGNMSGIRVDGHLMKFETSILIAKDGCYISYEWIKKFKAYTRDIDRTMEENETTIVKNGEVTFTLDKVSFTSLMTKWIYKQ